MKTKKALIILNLKSGTGKIKSKLPKILDIISASEYEPIIHVTQGALDAQEVAFNYATNGIDRIICAGGDGTLDEVVRGVSKAETQTPIGYIPCGTTNDFGYTLGISSSIEESTKLAVSDSTRLCDLATFNGKYYTYTAAFGLFTDVSYGTPQTFKNIFGRLAYLLNGAMHLPQTKPVSMKVIYEDEEGEHKVSGKFIHGMVANSNSVGGFRNLIGSEVVLDDGYFEMILFKWPNKPSDLVETLNELRKHRYHKDYVIYKKVKRAKFVSPKLVPWTLDGEYGDTVKEGYIEVKKREVKYIIK